MPHIMPDAPDTINLPTWEQLRALVASWEGSRFPAYHCANDLRDLLDKGYVPGAQPGPLALRYDVCNGRRP